MKKIIHCTLFRIIWKTVVSQVSLRVSLIFPMVNNLHNSKGFNALPIQVLDSPQHHIVVCTLLFYKGALNPLPVVSVWFVIEDDSDDVGKHVVVDLLWAPVLSCFEPQRHFMSCPSLELAAHQPLQNCFECCQRARMKITLLEKNPTVSTYTKYILHTNKRLQTS